jgi:predicted RNA-binding Zn-ribbon protein involved in translation (DUF1610 family)
MDNKLMPSSNPISSDTRDAVIDSSRRSMHRHVKRKFDTAVVCSECEKFHVVSNKTVRYLCPHCGKGNNVEEAIKRYEEGDFIMPENKRSEFGGASIKSSEARDYFNLRDEYEIRADLYKDGKTRETMGATKFNKTLKKELQKNKCYRGPEQTGV